MRRTVPSVLALVVAMAGVALAQQTPPPSSGSQPQGESKVVSGCLIQSRADTTTASRDGFIYTLDVVEPNEKSPTDVEGAAARAAAVSKTRYALSFEDAIDAAKHAGHHVQVTGRVLPRPAADKTMKGSDVSAAAAKPLPGTAHQMLHVTALKMIAAKCP